MSPSKVLVGRPTIYAQQDSWCYHWCYRMWFCLADSHNGPPNFNSNSSSFFVIQNLCPISWNILHQFIFHPSVCKKLSDVFLDNRKMLLPETKLFSTYVKNYFASKNYYKGKMLIK